MSAVGLSGGSGSPTVTSVNRRAYSTNLLVEPVDYRYLQTDASSINVHVKTNDVPSVCTGNCAYAFNTYTEMTTLSRAADVLTVALSDPTTANFALNTITITVGGQACSGVTGSLAAITCNMATNTDGTAILVAGDVTPVVAISQYGIAARAAGVAALSIPLVATSLTVTTGGNNGGYLISLNGAGFPLEKSKISITMCNNVATISSINNIKVDFYVPACATLGA